MKDLNLLTVSQLNRRFPLTGEIVKTSGGGFLMKVLAFRYKDRWGHSRESFDFFETDQNGKVLQSPKGYRKEFNKRVRIVGLDKYTTKEKRNG